MSVTSVTFCYFRLRRLHTSNGCRLPSNHWRFPSKILWRLGCRRVARGCAIFKRSGQKSISALSRAGVSLKRNAPLFSQKGAFHRIIQKAEFGAFSGSALPPNGVSRQTNETPNTNGTGFCKGATKSLTLAHNGPYVHVLRPRRHTLHAKTRPFHDSFILKP